MNLPYSFVGTRKNLVNLAHVVQIYETEYPAEPGGANVPGVMCVDVNKTYIFFPGALGQHVLKIACRASAGSFVFSEEVNSAERK